MAPLVIVLDREGAERGGGRGGGTMGGVRRGGEVGGSGEGGEEERWGGEVGRMGGSRKGWDRYSIVRVHNSKTHM